MNKRSQKEKSKLKPGLLGSQVYTNSKFHLKIINIALI